MTPDTRFKDLPSDFHMQPSLSYFIQRNGFPSLDLVLLRPAAPVADQAGPPQDRQPLETHLQAAPEGPGIGTHFICIFQDSVIQDEGLAPLLHQHVGLGDEKTPGGKGKAQAARAQLPKGKALLEFRLNLNF